MKTQYVLHGWHLSYFSGKLRAYMRYKGLDFEDRPVNAYNLTVKIPKKTGATVMPVVETQQGEWLQDTTSTIEWLEQRHAEPSITPDGPVQQIAAMLIEAWADEWWVPIAMHYRWSYPENYALFEQDAGEALLPYAPKFLRNRLVEKSVAGKLRGYLSAVGVVPEQQALMESWTENMLDTLDQHFSQHHYLLGGRPSVADFALVGPMYGHLNRDPMPKRELLDVRPHLQAWVDRVHGGEPATGDWLPNDALPASLAPLFTALFAEFMPMVEQIAQQVRVYVAENKAKAGDRIPRSLPEIRFPMAAGHYSRMAMPYTLWMVQRVRDHYAALTSDQQMAVDEWLQSQQQPAFAQMELGPTLQRRALATRLA